MNVNFSTCFAFTVGVEGAYGDDPRDGGNWSGGAVNAGVLVGTCWGVSAPVLRVWRGVAITADDMRNLSVGEAQQIFRALYWTKVSAGLLPAGIDLMVVDDAYNRGVGAAGRIVQTALGFSGSDVDGEIGPHTLGAIEAFGAFPLLAGLIAGQAKAYAGDSGFGVYAHGWLRRLGNRISAASDLM